jgi:RHS repeat-associated protein
VTASGVSPEALAVPKGSSVHGLGGDFVADLNTGGGSYSIPVDVPEGVEGHTPQLTLQYATGASSGPFGLGWALPLLRIERVLEGGLPRYDETDRLTLAGAGPLVALPDGGLVPEADGLGWRIRGAGDGFEATDRSGVRHMLGTDPAGRVADPARSDRVFAWLLRSSISPTGDTIAYEWQVEGAQRLLRSVSWAAYRVELLYEDRPDPELDGRTGFLLATTRRCARIELHVADHLTGGGPSLIRSWTLRYSLGQPTGHSLLSEVEYAGHGAEGEVLTVPPLRIGYQAASNGTARLDPVTGAELLGRPQATLADLSGDGLPDLLDLTGGRLTVARNRGGLEFDPPRAIDTRGVPGFAATAPMFLADVAGRGRVDICSVRHGLGYRYPVENDATIGRPVVAPAGPTMQPGVDGVRLLDLDGDGRSDLASVGGGVLTAVLPDGGTWRVQQSRVPAELAGVDTADPELSVAPMKGDGLPDLVRVRSGEVRWWPALGHGRWAEPRVIASSPVLPAGYRRDRLFVLDVDGDGCADLVYVDDDRVRVWCNRGGDRFEPELIIGPVPGRLVTRVEPADLAGQGLVGLLLCTGVGRRARTWHVTLADTPPYLLASVDNGLGEGLTVRYGSSVAEARRDREAGRPWSTFLPFPVPVVVERIRSVGAGAAPERSRYRYHDGAWDTSLRRFLGFGRVETIEEGDESAAGAITVTEFHGGRPPERADQPAPPLEKLRAQARRGLVIRTERYAHGPDGEPAELLMRVHQDWRAEVTDRDGALTAQPRLVERREEYLDGAAEPWRTTVTRTHAWDEFGNMTEQEQRFERTAPDGEAQVEVVRTTTTYATDAERWIVDREARTVQVDASGRLLHAKITYYDGPEFVGLPEGMVALGRITREERLALTDELALEAYSDDLPDLEELGYHRRDDLPGWWIHERRLDWPPEDPTRLVSLDPRGNRLEIRLDPDRLFPVERRDARGNIVTATRDPRAGRVATVDDGNGISRSRYDSRGWLIAEHRPGNGLSAPTVTHAYHLDRPIVTVETSEFPRDGRHDRITRVTLVAGDVEEVGTATLDEDGSWVVADAVCRNSQGRPARAYLPHRLGAGETPDLPPLDAPHVATTYDAMGRIVSSVAPDGSRRRVEYGPGRIRRVDEEENVTTVHLDGRGNVAQVVAGAGEAEAVIRYRYDDRDELAEVTDAAGRVTRILHDLLGRRLRLDDPAADVTLYVYDAAGNLVERRNGLGERTMHRYDALNRRIATEHPGSDSPPVEYRYVDLADPPARGRLERRIGRLHQVVDALGTTTLDYDERGEVNAKRIDLATGGTHRIGRRTDRLGRLVSVTYPGTGSGEPARTRFRYNRRGLVSAVDGIVDAIEYDDAGLPVATRYANGVRTEVTRDPLGRVTRTVISGPDGEVLDERQLAYDLASNVVAATGSSPEDSWTYILDSLYQLREAVSASGPRFRYDFSPAGDVTFRSDVGECRYGEDGARAPCLTTAGDATLRYDTIGRLVESPAGRFRYDPIDRLVSMSRDDVEVAMVHGALEDTWVRSVTRGGETQTIVQLDDGVELHDGRLVCSVRFGERVIARFTPGASLTVLHHDHRGSTTLVTAGDGTVRLRIRYDPWGRILSEEADGGDGETLGEVPRFDGYRLLEEFSLYLSPTRAYDPLLGRFTTPDPAIPDLLHPAGHNRYAYAANNPATVTDPSGLWWKTLLAAIALVAVAVITVLTYGATSASLVVLAGMVVGGAVGGIAAWQKGGDIALGIFAGAAIGGTFALGGAVASAAIGKAIGGKGAGAFFGKFLGKAVGGVLGGVGGGFASGIGALTGGYSDGFWKNVWVGALYGLAFTVAAYSVSLFGGNLINSKLTATSESLRSRLSAALELFRRGSETTNIGGKSLEVSMHVHKVAAVLKEVGSGLHKVIDKVTQGKKKKSDVYDEPTGDELRTAAITGTRVIFALDLQA